MSVSTMELAEARDMIQSLLEELGLKAYIFEIEPTEGGWSLRIDCALNGGWQSTRLEIPHRQLADCRRDHNARRALLSQWRRCLERCQRDS